MKSWLLYIFFPPLFKTPFPTRSWSYTGGRAGGGSPRPSPAPLWPCFTGTPSPAQPGPSGPAACPLCHGPAAGPAAPRADFSPRKGCIFFLTSPSCHVSILQSGLELFNYRRNTERAGRRAALSWFRTRKAKAAAAAPVLREQHHRLKNCGLVL